MSDYKNNIHNEPIINKKEMTKERKEKNDKAYNDWLNEKLSKEKEKKIQDKNKKMEQLEKEKKDIEMKNKMDQRRNEKLDEWFNTKKEQEKNKKKLEEKHKKEEELKKEKQKQMENDNFKAWCQKKDQEKRNLKGKNLEVKFHVAEHTEAWVDPNAPPKENPPIVRDASQTTSLQSSRLCLYKSKSKIRNKGKGLLSATSMSDSICGSLVINYKDINLFSDSEKKLFTKHGNKSAKKKKSKKNNKVNGSYGNGIFGEYDAPLNKINKRTSFNSTSSSSKESSTSVNNSSSLTSSNTTKSSSSKKNQNLPPSLFEDYKKYENYPDFKRKYPLLIGNAGLEMLLLEQIELQNEEKRRGIPSKLALTHQVIQITGRKNTNPNMNLPLKGNISFNLASGSSYNDASSASSSSTSRKDISGKKEGKKKSQMNLCPNIKRRASNISSCSSSSSLSRSSLNIAKNKSKTIPETKPVKDLIDPSLLQYLIENQNLEYHTMCKVIKEKLLEDHITSIIANDDGKTKNEREEELLNSKYHTTRQRLSDLFQNKVYLENLLKSLSSKQ